MVKLSELLLAIDFVSAGDIIDHSAYVDAQTGTIYWLSEDMEIEAEVPEDIEGSERYIPIPHKHDLDLGQELVFSFVENEFPQDYELVVGIFRKKGAYARYKAFLESKGCLEKWYEYENQATEAAVRSWCKGNALEISSEDE